MQVKSCYATDFDGGFPIKNMDCGFVVFVALKRGYRHRRKKHANDTGVRTPEFYVLPVEVVRAVRKLGNSWSKVFLKYMDGAEEYVSRWDLIREYLELNPWTT